MCDDVAVVACLLGVGTAAVLEPGAEASLFPLSFAFSLALAFAFGFGALHAVRVLQFALAVGAIACQPVWTDCCAWCGSVCWRRVEHRPRLVAAVLELLLVDQVLVDVIDEGLVAALRVVLIPFAEACYLFFEPWSAASASVAVL